MVSCIYSKFLKYCRFVEVSVVEFRMPVYVEGGRSVIYSRVVLFFYCCFVCSHLSSRVTGDGWIVVGECHMSGTFYLT